MHSISYSGSMEAMAVVRWHWEFVQFAMATHAAMANGPKCVKPPANNCTVGEGSLSKK